MTKVYLSFKKRMLLLASAVIGFFAALIGGGSHAPSVSADAPGQNLYQDVSPGPCPSPGCCGT